MKNRVCCLYRVSTTKQVNYDQLKQADIPMQRKACHKFAESMGWEIVQEEQEAGISGFKVSASNRNAIIKIKDDALKGKFDILLVFMFDRLGRKEDETPFIVEWFVTHGIEVWSVKEGQQRFDHHVDFLMNYIRFWQASGESKKTAMRTKTALEQLVAEGRFRGGIAPYGYQLESSGIFNKRKHEVMKLSVVENEANIVRMMFQLCVNSGYGRCRIAAFLNECGIHNRNGLNWHEATIAHILHNVLYTGILRSGNSRSEVIPELQIIPLDTFRQAQTLMQERTNSYGTKRTLPRNTCGRSLLSGNIFCGHCGGRLCLTSNSTEYVKADGTHITRNRIRYICYNKTRKQNPCNGQTGYTAHILDAKVKAYLRQVFTIIKTNGVTALTEQKSEQLAIVENELQNINHQLNEAQCQYDEMKTRLAHALKTAEPARLNILMEVLDSAYEKVAVLKQKQLDLRSESEELTNAVMDAEKNCARLLEWANIFEVCSGETQKMIAGYILKRVDVFRDYNLSIQLNDFGIANIIIDHAPIEQT